MRNGKISTPIEDHLKDGQPRGTMMFGVEREIIVERRISNTKTN
jgi:hypothetical protein